MRRYYFKLSCSLCAYLATILTWAPVADAATDVWDTAASGFWSDNIAWLDNTAPGNSDAALFNQAGSYTVSFLVSPPAIQILTMSAGNVTFAGLGGGKTLAVNSASGGQSVTLTGGSVLTLGTSGNPLQLTAGDRLVVLGGSTLQVNFGSQVNTLDLFVAQSVSGNGAVVVDGIGSQLNATASSISPGLGGNEATIIYRNSAQGSLATAGTVNLGSSGSAASSATLTVELDADLDVGHLNIGTGTAAATGTVNVHGAGSTLDLLGSSTLTVGHATAAGIGALNIGVGNTGGSVMVNGLMTINPHGTVTLGGGANTGTLNANGDVLINGGVLQRKSSSGFTLAAGKTATLQNGGRAEFTSNYTTPTNVIFNVTGSGSKLETLASGGLTINNGAQVNVSSGGAVASAGALNVGTSSSGTLSVDGAGSTAESKELDVTFWGRFGGAANVSFSNGAAGAVDGALSLAGSDNAGTAATVSVLSGAELELVGDLSLATVGGSSTTATLNINGANSAVTQGSVFGSPKDITVGHSSMGSAAINIGTTTSGGTLITDDGEFTINKTGTVTVGSGPNAGTLSANGDLAINGGSLAVGPAGTFNQASGKTFDVLAGGQASFNSFHNTPLNALYNVSGAGSTLTTQNFNFRINEGAQVNVAAGGTITALFLPIGITTDGTLTVDGSGSTVTATAVNDSTWGNANGLATVTFSNGSAGTFNGGLTLAGVGGTQPTAVVTMQSGAHLNVGNLSLASMGSANASATLTVTGSGSAVALVPGAGLTVGHATAGVATLQILDSATLTVGAGGATTLKATGAIKIDGGIVDLKTLNDQGGVINFTAGSMSYLGNLTVGTDGLLGENLILNADRRVTLSGSTTVDAGRNLTLSGGTLNTGTLAVNGTFNFIAGTLGITQAGAAVNAPIVTGNPTTINIGANNIALGIAASFTGFDHQGTLNVGSNTVTLNSAGYASLGVLTSLNGGTINTANGVTLPGGSNLLGHGTVNAQVTGELGAVIEADGALALGQAASPAGFNFGGQLRVKQHAVTINASAQAGLGNLTTLGSGVNAGTLNAANGLVVDFAEAITGFGTINSTNMLAKRTIVNGVAQGNSALQPLTFTGYVKGVGTFDNVTFAGTIDPGLSPTLMTVGNITLAATSTLLMEVGGLSRGSQYDAILASGNLALDGTLRLELLNGFSPTAGAAFDLLDWSSLSGTFDALELPPLVPGLAWNTSQLYATGVLSIAPAYEADFDEDGDVDGNDLASWRRGFGESGATHARGDADTDLDVDGADFLSWQRQLGSAAASASSAAVPEPATALLLTAVAAGVIIRSGARARRELMS